MLPYTLPDTDVYVGERLRAMAPIEAVLFAWKGAGNVPLNLKPTRSVDYSKLRHCNHRAVRCVKLALDRNISGPLIAPSSYGKSLKQFKMMWPQMMAYIRG
jgi:myo-inositol-1-phosphate synthase